MWSARQGQFKIGTAENTWKRQKNHATSSPDIELVAAVQHASAGAIETRLLSHFKRERVGMSECLEDSADVRAWVERFRSRPNVATSHEQVANSYTTPDLWPWSEDAGPIRMDGQIGLDMTLGPYVPDQGSGNGQTSAISEDWYTPAVYVEATRELLGTIDLDPASCPEANLTVRAENIYTAEVDGLRHRWFGNVFLNPPWGRVGKPKRAFVTKAIAAYEAGEITAAVLALNSNATTSAWFQPLFRYPICFPNHRVEHRGPGGSGGAPNSGTVFVYLGPDVEGFAQIFSRFGAILHELRAATAVSRKLAADYEDEAA